MTEKHTYQAMFLLENQEVRENGFNAVREQVKSTLEKHGVDVKVLRLWGERAMAYTIGGRKRATYLLAWLEGEGEAVNKAKADFYLVGPVFRCLFLRTEEIPEDELAFGIEAVSDEDLVIPEEIEEVEEEEEYIEPDEPPQIESEEEEEKKEEAAQEEGDASSDAKENTKNQETPEATPAGEEA